MSQILGPKKSGVTRSLPSWNALTLSRVKTCYSWSCWFYPPFTLSIYLKLVLMTSVLAPAGKESETLPNWRLYRWATSASHRHPSRLLTETHSRTHSHALDEGDFQPPVTVRKCAFVPNKLGHVPFSLTPSQEFVNATCVQFKARWMEVSIFQPTLSPTDSWKISPEFPHLPIRHFKTKTCFRGNCVRMTFHSNIWDRTKRIVLVLVTGTCCQEQHFWTEDKQRAKTPQPIIISSHCHRALWKRGIFLPLAKHRSSQLCAVFKH
jgi:hypothetical protein